MNKEKRLDSNSISTILTATIFAIAGAVPLFTAMGISAGLSAKEIGSSIMCGIFVSGLLSIYLSNRFKMPIYAAPSITAIAVISPLLKEFSLPEMVMGYLAAGAVLGLLGLFKLMEPLVKYIPIPIVLAMVAGVYMSYGLNLISGIKSLPLAGGMIVAVYFLASAISKKIPPQAAALLAAILATCFLTQNSGTTESSFELAFTAPAFTLPYFNPDVLIYVSLPLVIMSISDLFKGYGVLKANGFEVPLNKAALFCGGCSIISAFGLGHTISLAGPAIAILAGKNAGTKQERYINAMIFSAITAAIVLMAGTVIALLTLLPAEIINIICGLAMIGLLTSSLTEAFARSRFTLGALTAFTVGLSNVSILGIGAPVWSILFGIAVSLLAERGDFSAGKASASAEANS